MERRAAAPETLSVLFLHSFQKYPFIAVGAVELWVTRSVTQVPVVNRQVVHQVRQIHQPKEI